jgi:multicomponent Na+:H+ antiporter subunit A
MEVAAAVLSGFVLAVLAPGLQRLCGRASGWLLATLPAGLAGYFAIWLAYLPERGGLVRSCPWMPALGIELSFLLDGLGLLMALLITGIGALILVYAGGYLPDHPQLGRLHAFLLFFMASMLGLVLADNLIALFVF